jgi:hypothetical protein
VSDEIEHCARLHLDGQIEARDALICEESQTFDKIMKSYLAHKNCFPKGVSKEAFWTLGVALEAWFPSMKNELIFRPSKIVLQDYLGRGFITLPDELFQMILWDSAPRSTLARLGVALQFNTDVIKSLSSSAKQSLEFEFLNPALRAFAINLLGISYRPFLSESSSISDNSVIRLTLDHFGIRKAEILSQYPGPGESRSQPGTFYVRLIRLYYRKLMLHNA